MIAECKIRAVMVTLQRRSFATSVQSVYLRTKKKYKHRKGKVAMDGLYGRSDKKIDVKRYKNIFFRLQNQATLQRLKVGATNELKVEN